MTPIPEYCRPKDLAEALQLLRQPARRVAPLASGSWLTPRLHRDMPSSLVGTIDALVDLADLGLRYCERRVDAEQQWLCLGATTTLADIAEDPWCQEMAGGILARAAREDLPINMRNVVTVGGFIASSGSATAGGASQLLLALLALNTHVHVAIGDGQARVLPLPAVVADPAQAIGRGLIVEVRIPWLVEASAGGLACVARTPTDEPIVAAAAVNADRSVRVAIGGVASVPVLLPLTDPTELDGALANLLPGLDTPDDFRGSAEYRQAMALVIARRALAQATA